MKTVIDAPIMTVQPELAAEIGFNEALFLQQLHYLSKFTDCGQLNGGWVTKTLAEWTKYYSFWSNGTVRRTIYSLQEQQLILADTLYLQTRLVHTKSYKVHYDHAVLKRLQNQSERVNESAAECSKADARYEAELLEQDGHIDSINCSPPHAQNDDEPLRKTDRQVRKEFKEKEKNIKTAYVSADAVEAIVAYLNEKAGKHFQPSTRQTARLITARLKQGRKVEDFFQVIDTKCAQWLNDSKLCTYLRPSTLFSETNFENYLNEKPVYRERKIEPAGAIVLDFSKGEG